MFMVEKRPQITFMFKQKLLERKEQNFGVTQRNFSVKKYTCRMSNSCFKKAA